MECRHKNCNGKLKQTATDNQSPDTKERRFLCLECGSKFKFYGDLRNIDQGEWYEYGDRVVEMM